MQETEERDLREQYKKRGKYDPSNLKSNERTNLNRTKESDPDDGFKDS